MSKILILASNPRKDLDLNREIYFLRSIIESSRYDSQFDVVIGDAVRPGQLQQLFLEHRPRIVHFSGHGEGAKGLVMEDEVGEPCVVSTQALSNLFKNFAGTIECVLLNACYSEVQANAITEHINYVIGMNQAIQDKAAIDFTRGFYQAMGNGESIEQSYKLGCNEIELQNNNASTARSETATPERKFIPLDVSKAVFWQEHQKPVLKKKPNLTAVPVQQTVSQNERAEQRYQADVQNDFNLGQASPRRPSLTQQEYRQRQSLLSHVKSSWIEGVLETSLHNRKLLKLDLERRADAVQRSFHSADELPIARDRALEWLRATDIFEQMGTGRTLLILGEPGAGKTIELLNLAKRLIERTENDLSRPIPVVFNLSSWTLKRQSIADWLVEDLKDQYRASKSLGKKWVEQEELLLLLDGLDEVRAEHRNDCVRALNQFLEDHSTTEMVVCSRLKDYEKLSERLKLRSAIYIRPITPEYIDWYLEDVGKPLAGLKTVLKQDKELEEFAQTPLILNVMSWAYHGYSATEVLNQLGSADQRRQRLFDTYIKRMFDRKELPQIYSSKQTERWLTLLAQRMNQTSQTIFLIEKLQPSWLQTAIEKRAYQIEVNFFIPLLIFIFLLLSGVETAFSRTPLYLAFPFWFSRFIFTAGIERNNKIPGAIETVETIKWSWKEAMNVYYSVIKTTWWTLRTMNPNIILFIPLILCFFVGFSPYMVIAFGFRGPTIPEKIGTPNLGIRKSALNAGIFGLIFVGIAILFILYRHFSGDSLDRETALYYIEFCLFFGVIAGGGDAVIKHLSLRFILYCKGYSPWNYTRFLSYATDRIFLKQVGRGYIFIHRMLQEHFANMSISNKQ
ncbi:NACHT domain-containing protein [Microcoleus sp. T3_A4]|uniref:NACHT domain-containing protein n=1 Tax=Microcoleus sp. T3_A4 TaxID=2818968 RepID=UPI002FD0F32B